MNYSQLGKTQLNVSRLCLGTNSFGAGYISERDISTLVAQSLSLGINFIDTADVYNDGLSEILVGRAVARNRHDFVLATKGGMPVGPDKSEYGLSRGHMTKALDASLQRLGTDYIDLYQVHLWDEETPIEETLEVLDSFVRQGKVRYIGCSNFSADQLQQSLEISNDNSWNTFSSVQPVFNLIDRDIEKRLLPLCANRDIAVLPYQILMGGILTGTYVQHSAPDSNTHMASKHAGAAMKKYWNERSFNMVAALAAISERTGYSATQLMIGWALNKESITSVIVGSTKIIQLEENFQVISECIPEDILTLVDALQ